MGMYTKTSMALLIAQTVMTFTAFVFTSTQKNVMIMLGIHAHAVSIGRMAFHLMRDSAK
jgi:hypothetical protein